MARNLMASMVMLFFVVFLLNGFSQAKQSLESISAVTVTYNSKNKVAFEDLITKKLATKSGNTYTINVSKSLLLYNEENTYIELTSIGITEDQLVMAIMINADLETDPAESPNYKMINSLLDAFPIILLLFVVLQFFRLFAGAGAADRRARVVTRLHGFFGNNPNSKEFLQSILNKSIGISLESVFTTCGFRTIEISNRIADNEVVGQEPIIFTRPNILNIDSNFEWIVIDKHEKFCLYKVIGLHKSMKGLNCLYMFGCDEHTNTPYMIRVPYSHLKKSTESCRRWSLGASDRDIIIEV